MTTRQFYAAGRDTGVLIKRLEAAKEAAARADAKVEEIYAELQVAKTKADKHRKKVLQQEQTIQALENALSRQQDETARLRGELGEANRRNDNQYQLIQTLRVTRDEIRRKLLERMRKDLLNAWPQDNYLLVSDFKDAIDRYLQEIEVGVDP